MSDDASTRIRVMNPNSRPVYIQSQKVNLRQNDVLEVDRSEFDVRLLLKQKRLKQVYSK